GVQQLLAANLDQTPQISDTVVAIDEQFDYDQALEKFLDQAREPTVD
ncbi:MAG: hypothetical protein JKY89_04275, partial [Immundisolibacteraceae bacterium]|nr:hypothetical protein [Immundisolibacteraceae bacterium]